MRESRVRLGPRLPGPSPYPGSNDRSARAWRTLVSTTVEPGMPAAAVRAPEAGRAKTGKAATRDSGNFSRGFFTLLSDDRFDLMERTGSTWHAREKRKVTGAADGPY